MKNIDHYSDNTFNNTCENCLSTDITVYYRNDFDVDLCDKCDKDLRNNNE